LNELNCQKLKNDLEGDGWVDSEKAIYPRIEVLLTMKLAAYEHRSYQFELYRPPQESTYGTTAEKPLIVRVGITHMFASPMPENTQEILDKVRSIVNPPLSDDEMAALRWLELRGDRPITALRGIQQKGLSAFGNAILSPEGEYQLRRINSQERRLAILTS
jgi:hypothetical protein